MGEVDGLDGVVCEDDPQAHGHFAVVEGHDLGHSACVHFLFGGEATDVAHLLVVDFDGGLSVIQAEDGFQVVAVVDLFDAVVVEEEVLFLVFDELNVELGVLFLFLHDDQFSHQVPEDILESDAVPALGGHLPEHVLQTHHVQRTLLEGHLQGLQHQHDEMLHPHLLLRHPRHFFVDLLQFLLEDLPADVHWGIFFQRLLQGVGEVFLAVVQSDLHGLLPFDEFFQGIVEILVQFFLLLPELLQFLLFHFAHKQNYQLCPQPINYHQNINPSFPHFKMNFPLDTPPSASFSLMPDSPCADVLTENQSNVVCEYAKLLWQMAQCFDRQYSQQNKTAMSLGDFSLLAKIGEGAYSSVHKAKRTSDGVIYALKKVRISNLNEKEKQNALNEVRLLASINSDYIIKYKEAFFDSSSNSLCIVMEFAEGGDLEKVIEKKKRTMSWVEEREIWTMMGQVLNGIAVLHERNIIHRDLKSANIFICGGVYKVADLNVSKLLKKDLAYTQTGTPYYASPEVWQDKPYELKSDIWSFGCILYELCALKPPFTGTSMEGLFRKVMKGVYPKIPSVYSTKLANIISLCLQLDPAKRPTAKRLLKLMEENEKEDSRSRISSVNLLNTIKIPKNIRSWKNELPKADYDTLSEKPADEVSHPKYGNISQSRLREIVKSKNEEMALARKGPAKKVNPEYVLQSNRNDRSVPEKALVQKNVVRKGQIEVLSGASSGIPGLPRIKVHSQPNERVAELLARMKEEERKRYDYNRPSWWG